ncbi:SDR family NAD(P)-dependent oxidoreductase [Tenggerimyces flavus]|uniref:SDR family NAD(P)-dependent oxidoreductase n=1 Tax=Tenggerimyces flavus TaxID=1708749 RepID=A0ABV7Y5P9_9ACTN|nr:SDR family NAD(P)-dependent oxidoreductase [Tenggerimyces flavus]MBM7788399.1 NAD(P)-dependent dehydrogenase (short-subunit alcohol dehydrogenase family) [Tenggerimyces flavus]
MPGIVVIGAGPGVGRAVAARFAKEGMPVALIARTPKKDAVTFTADVADVHGLERALDQAVDAHGIPDVVVYNAAVIQPDGPATITADELTRTFQVNVGGAFTAAAHLAPRMKNGSFLLTGGMPHPVKGYLSLSIGKGALRTLTTLLAEEYDHLHVATITIGGDVVKGTKYDPDAIAEHYWQLHTQPKHQWERERTL